MTTEPKHNVRCNTDPDFCRLDIYVEGLSVLVKLNGLLSNIEPYEIEAFAYTFLNATVPGLLPDTKGVPSM